MPGIDVTNDPLMQARLFSYLDTQLTRLGGPNFSQLPINCPHAAVNDNLRDGMHQTAIHTGVAPYLPNSIDGSPLVADAEHGGYVSVPTEVSGAKVRQSPVSFEDHFSQATLFWRSMTDIERDHIVEAFTFELGKARLSSRSGNASSRCWPRWCRTVRAGGRRSGAAGAGTERNAGRGRPVARTVPDPARSRADRRPVVGVVAGPGADLAGIAQLRRCLGRRTGGPPVIAPTGGTLGTGKRTEEVERTLLTTRSISSTPRRSPTAPRVCGT